MAKNQYSSIVRNAISKPQADLTYLKLDCSNDPLQADLDTDGFDINMNFSVYDVNIKDGTFRVIREGYLDQQ